MWVAKFERPKYPPQSVLDESKGSTVWILPGVLPCLPWIAEGITNLRSMKGRVAGPLELAEGSPRNGEGG